MPEQAKQAMERAMTNLMIRHQERVQTLEQRGIKSPAAPDIQPGQLRKRLEKRIREQQMEWSVPDDVPQGQGQIYLAYRR